MEAFSLASITAGVLTGILGNTADRALLSGFKAFINYLKQGGKPVNHDLQKALRRCFLSALQTIASECLEEQPPPQLVRERHIYHNLQHQTEIEWLERKLKQLASELKKINQLTPDIAIPISSLDEIESLLTPEGKLAQERIQILKEKLLTLALDDDVIPCYKAKIEDSLFERVCAFFVFEIKNNQVVRDILASQLLAQINVNLQGQQLTIEDVEAYARSTAAAVPQVLNKLDNLEVAIQQLGYNLENLNQGVSDVLFSVNRGAAGIEEIKALLKQALEKQSHISSKVRHNLPQPDYGQFIGREAELAKVTRQMRPYPHCQHSLVTIDGIGGIGKSALALEVAHRFLNRFESLLPEERFAAIIWTSAKRNTLKPDKGIVERRQVLRTLEDICQTIALTLGIEDQLRSQTENKLEFVCRALTQQTTLLIVDNLETVDDEAMIEFLQELPAPTKAIVTTRHRIDVAYPVRLQGMPWEDAKTLIEQECQKKEVTLNDEQTHKLFDRTGGVPLAIVWSVAQMGFGYPVDTVLARLGSPNNDIARFCFEETVAQIRGNDAYKLLLALALCISDASREELGFVAGFGEDEMSRDDGLVQLEKLSLVNKQGDKFSMLPLTKEYAKHELEAAGAFTIEAASRLVEYNLQYDPLSSAIEYLIHHKTKLSQYLIKKALRVIGEHVWYEAQSCGFYYPAFAGWVQLLVQVGGEEAVQELKSWLDTFISYDQEGWNTIDCIDALGNLGEHEFLVDSIKKYQRENWIKTKCIEVIEKSGKKELVQPLQELLREKTNEDIAAKLQEVITKLEQAQSM